MRLLHPRNSTHCQGSFGRKSPSDPRRDPSSPVGKSLPLHRLHEDFASRRASRKGNFWMTLFINLATSAIKKSPLVLLCQRGKLQIKKILPLFQRGVRGDFWTRVI